MNNSYNLTNFLLIKRTMSKISESSETSDIDVNENITNEGIVKNNKCYDIFYLTTIMYAFQSILKKIRECIEIQ